VSASWSKISQLTAPTKSLTLLQKCAGGGGKKAGL